jgi:hypothetical protein
MNSQSVENLNQKNLIKFELLSLPKNMEWIIGQGKYK